MKKYFEIPQLTIAQFELENVVTESMGSTYKHDAEQFTIHGTIDLDKKINYANQVIKWTF